MIKKIIILFITSFVLSCSDDNEFTEIEPKNEIEYSFARSIFFKKGKVLTTGIKNSNNNSTTEFWIDNIVTDSISFVHSLEIDDVYQGSVDNSSRITYINKTVNGNTDLYSFNQGVIVADNNISYYNNNNLINTEIPNPGVLSTVNFFNGQPFFCGHFSKDGTLEEVGGQIFSPDIPFFWDGDSSVIQLPIPEELFFRGTSCLFVDENDFYVGGKTSFPMYWKNTEIIKLGDLYGQVNQIILSEESIYAVGFYNKNNSNSIGNIACYWKNGELFELDDDAQANSIYIDGNDIYVCGSTGNVPIEYNACYWKNGIRVDLPM